MTESEISTGELSRSLSLIRVDLKDGLQGINSRLDNLVPSDVFNAERKRTDERLQLVAKDLEEERALRKEVEHKEREDTKSAVAALQLQLDKLIATQKWIVITLLVPIGLFAGNIWLSTRGGS